MKEVNDHHAGNIKFPVRPFEPLVKRILCFNWSDCKSITEGNPTYDSGYRRRQLKQTINTSACNGMASPIDEISCSLHLLVKVPADPTDSEIQVRDPPHSVKMRLWHQTAWAWTESVITNCRQENPGCCQSERSLKRSNLLLWVVG